MATDSIAQRAMRRQFTESEYIFMHEQGMFGEGDRVELLDGDIIKKNPVGPLHVIVTSRLCEILWQLKGDQAIVIVQSTIQLNDRSLPEPDVALLRTPDAKYETALASPADVLLLIEVAHTSLEYDRLQKLPLYAAADVPEVWIVDLNQQQVEQYTQPHEGQYTQLTKVTLGRAIEATLLPSVKFTTDRLFSWSDLL